MKIYVDQIPESGLELSEDCQPATLDLNREDIKFTEPIKVSAQITKEISTISIRLKIEAQMHLNCSRFLEDFTLPFFKELVLNLPIKDQKVIDTVDNLREEIILSYPLKPLCRLDCLGLCPLCGQNLNQGKCNCQKKSKLTE